MTGILRGKITAITGGATGIGRAIAIKYAEQGAKVAVNHLGDAPSRAAIRTLREEIAARSGGGSGHETLLDFTGDISRPGAADAFLAATAARWGRLDVLVANAGIARFHDFLTTPDAWIGEHLAVNVGGCYYATRAAGRIMKEQHERETRREKEDGEGSSSVAGTSRAGGSIIGIASISALCGSGQLVDYTPTKAAVLSIMQSAAVALGPYGVRCNALLPGTIETRLNREDLAVPEKRRAVVERTTLKRVGKPEDIAGPAVFLASDMSKYCSGAQLLVDGGLFVNQQ